MRFWVARRILLETHLLLIEPTEPPKTRLATPQNPSPPPQPQTHETLRNPSNWFIACTPIEPETLLYHSA